MTDRAGTSRGPDVQIPTTRVLGPAGRRQGLLHAGVWLLIALPALYQIGLLVTAIGGRFSYPYDLEWMEGGMLQHAQRIRDGVGIYVPPSVDFIPYLYTPLYPSVLALFGGAFGMTYSVGRAISILSLLGIAATAAIQIPSSRHEHVRRGPPWAGVALGLGLFSAAYPISDGWYDLVRADTMFLMLITVGIGALPRWCKTGEGVMGHLQVAASATILALAFFCKQTGIIYVGFGGVMVLVLQWRRLPAYVLTAGALGLGGTWVMQRATDGWFWTYVSEIHRAHDFSMDRFWRSFGNILWRTEGYSILGGPIAIVVVAALILVLVTRIKFRVLPPQTRPLLIWSSVFGVSVIVGAIGWGTEFAHFNAYIPAELHGALASGAALPAVFACTRLLWADRPRSELVCNAATAAFALPLAITCITAAWSPSKFIPTDADVAAGDKLIARIREMPGEVWIPSHPWYLELAGKTPRVHRMGIKDVTTRQTRTVEGLDEVLSTHGFSAIILDNADLHNRENLPLLHQHYHSALRIPDDERPRVFTGARVIPDEIWLPVTPAVPPPGVRVIFDFEAPNWNGWKPSGPAWGNRPTETPLSGQGVVSGFSGRRFANSMYGGDKETGRIESPTFDLGSKLTIRIGGGTDTNTLRVELFAEDTKAPIYVVSVDPPGGDAMITKTFAIPADKRGRPGHLLMIDDSTTSHLVVDDVWSWP